MTNTDKLQAVFRKVFQAPASVDMSSVKYGESPAGKEWDSLKHMVLCTLLEDEFDVMIDISFIPTIRSFNDAMTALTELGISFKE